MTQKPTTATTASSEMIEPSFHQELLQLRADLLALSPDDWLSICKCILIPNDENITINKSGVHFCLMSISEQSISDMKKFLVHKQIETFDTSKPLLDNIA